MTPIFSKKNSGFSIIELLIAIFLGLIVITAVYCLFILQNQTYVNQNQIAEMQQNVRSAMDIFSADFRLAGFGFSIKTSDPDTIGGTYTFSTTGNRFYAVTPNNSSAGPDSVIIRYGINPDPNNPNANVSLTNAMANSNSSIALVVSNAAGFAAGDYVIISDGQNASCLLISGAPIGNALPYSNTTSNIFPSGGFAAGSHIYKLKRVSYQISNNVLQSQKDNGPWQDVVNNIEDLQVGYKGTSGTWADNPNPTNRTTITDVQINILARSNTQDLQFTGQRPQIRDHAAGAVDHYRRRLLTSSVKLRNL